MKSLTIKSKSKANMSTNQLNNKDNKKELQNNIDKNNNNNNEESSTELKKKLKIIESKIVEMRNKNQILKDENSKLIQETTTDEKISD